MTHAGAGTVLTHWTGYYAVDISRPSFDTYHYLHATSCRTTWFIHEEPAGVKCTWKRGCLFSQALTSGVLWVA